MPHPVSPRRRRLSRLLALVGALPLTFAVALVPNQASAASAAVTAAPATPASGAAATGPMKPDVQQVCPPATKGTFTCFALRRTDTTGIKGLMPNAATPAGFGPADLLSAYNLPADGGAGATVAIVDAHDDPSAEADLALYRAQYGLPECTTANGCFKKVDETGGTAYPSPDAGWAGEISLDLDMVSAIAPKAHIILVEATTASVADLGAAVDEAVALGAGYVSNSYGSGYSTTPGSGEDPSELTDLDPHYNHPGVAVVASSGDGDYGVSYPAASQYVTAVGGTSLVKDSSARGWSESVWSNSYGGPGSGCSLYEPKPAFQHDTGCDKRAEADVSAVADPATGVAVYDSYQATGWQVYGGTSVSAPLVTGVYAVAGTPGAGTYPNAYPYANTSSLNDVTQGSNGSCTPAYLCTAGPGFDGPTGLGTPNGLAAFRSGPHGTVKGAVTDGTAPVGGASISVGGAKATTAADGTYSLTVPPGTYDVTVSAFGFADQTVSGVAVADGGTVTEDFTLAAVARVPVTGKVTDGSGQGWPLYASITVDGVPGGPAYTNPKTGAYSLNLPVNAIYQLHVTPVYPGYLPQTSAVTVGTSAVTHPVAVPVDPACSAPGYAIHPVGAAQSFDGTSTPAGWTVTDATADGGWEFDDPGHRGNLTGGKGGFAVIDSDALGNGKHQDTTLLSPVADLTSVTAPELDFSTYYKSYSNSTATVEVSVDDGATWTGVWSASTTTVPGQQVRIPLPQAAGKSQVLTRFHYVGSWAYYWELDDFLLGTTTCDPLPGGLVVGQVTDANTKAALPGVVVSETAAPTVSGTSAATADPALKGAFYWLFSPATGSVGFSAVKAHYTTGQATATVPTHGVVEVDHALKAGRLTVTPAAVAKTVGWGASATQTVTVKNTGSAPATMTIGEQPGGFVMQGVTNAPTQIVPAKVTMGNAAKAARQLKAAAAKAAVAPTAGDSWQPLANYPTPIQDDIADVYQGKLYAGFGYDGSNDAKNLNVYDPTAGTWSALAPATDTRESPAHGFIGGKLYVVGGWGPSGSADPAMEVYDPATNTWSAGTAAPVPYAGSGSAVVGSKLYVVGGCTDSCGTTDVYAFDAVAKTWAKLAAYPETTSWLSCGDVLGKLYCAGGSDGTNTSKNTYVYDPSADSWSALAAAPAGFWGAAGTAANGRLLVTGGVVAGGLTNQSWAYDPAADAWSALPNSNASAYRFAGALGFYTVGGGQGQLVPPLTTTQVLPGYDVGPSTDVPWLTESAGTLTLAAGKSATFTVTVNGADPSVLQPGDYTAGLVLGSDTPYQVPALPVTMHVNPPSTWGKITGTVTSTDASGKTVPLAGATVQIDTWATHYTLHTDINGAYGLWLDYRNNPLTVIAAKDGFQPQVKTVKIKKGATLTTSFVLLKD